MEMCNNKLFQRIISLLLCVTMLLPMFAVPVNAEEVTGSDGTSSSGALTETLPGEVITVIAGSDFQPSGGDIEAGKSQVTSILEQIKKTYATADGFLFGGDYTTYSTTSVANSVAGKTALQEALHAVYGTAMDEVYVQGNHDPDSLVTDGTLSPSGANDASGYGVYVLNEKDYMWYGNEEETVKNTASDLKAYLNAKCMAGYTKPIFIVSHLPLHYTMRTSRDGDARYGNYIFDVVNEAGANGLNIIFLFSHNHSNSWDDHLGGSAIYLAKGDSINIAQASKTEVKAETLNFTYMNAGYVGYYSSDSEGEEADLTMTVFQITDDAVTIKRYSADGEHDLKSQGVAGTYDADSTYPLTPNTKVYTSPQTVKLNKVVSDTSVAADVTVEADGVTAVQAVKGASQIPTGYDAYQTYGITATGYTDGDTATVTIPVESPFDASRPVIVIDHEENEVIPVIIEDGNVTFTADHLGQFTLAQVDDATAVSAEGSITGKLEQVTTDTLQVGVSYIITSHYGNLMLTNTPTSSVTTAGTNHGLLLEGTPGDDDPPVWYLKDGVLENSVLVYGSADSEEYLRISYDGSGDNLTGNVQTGEYYQSRLAYVIFRDDGNGFNIKRNANSLYLNQLGGEGSTNASSLWYSSEALDSAWNFYEYIPDWDVTLTVAPSQSTIPTTGTVLLMPTILSNGKIIADHDIVWGSGDESIATVSDDGVVTPKKAGQVYMSATVSTVAGYALTSPITVKIPITVSEVSMADESITATMVQDQWLKPVTDLTADSSYVISSYNNPNWVLTNTVGDAGNNYVGLKLEPFDTDTQDHIWYIEEVDGVQYLRYGSMEDDSNYLLLSTSQNRKIELGGSTGGTLFAVDEYDSGRNAYLVEASSRYLNQVNGADNDVAAASSYTCYWYFNEVMPERTITLTVSPRRSIMCPGQAASLIPTVEVDGSAASDYILSWSSSDLSVAMVDANGKVTAVGGGNATITASLTSADGVDLGAVLSVEIPIQVTESQQDENGISASIVLGERLQPVTELQEGVPYIITSYNDPNWVLTDEYKVSGINSNYSGLRLEHFDLAGQDHVWYYVKETVDGVEKQYLRYGSLDADDNYLINAYHYVNLGTADNERFDSVLYNEYYEAFQIVYSGNQYVYQVGGKGNDTASRSSATGSPTIWNFNTVLPESDLSMTVSPALSEMYPTQTQTETLTPTIFLDGEEATDYKLTWSTSDPSVATVYEGKVTAVKGGTATIIATLHVVNGRKLDTPLILGVPITVKTVQSATVSNATAEVAQNANTKVEAVEDLSAEIVKPVELTLTYTDGTTQTVAVTPGMLTDANGKRVSTDAAGTLSDLTVNYGGYQLFAGEFTLKVITPEQPDQPAYPEEGSVYVNKTGLGVNFQSSGVANIELSTAGVPVKTGADVIIMLDTSSSMNDLVDGVARDQVLTESLNDLLNTLQAEDASGQKLDIRVAIADFNTYFNTDEYSYYYIDPNDKVTDGSSQFRQNYKHDPLVYTGSEKLDADAFVDVHDLGTDPFTYTGEEGKLSLDLQSGTNYDYAFDAVYQLGAAITEENATGEERDLFVIFMTDGEPLQYNYFSTWSGATYWNNWLTGTMTDEMFAEGSNKSYYNEDGLHWMAEAIKGDPTEDYPVIRKNDPRDTDGDNFITVPGLGATMYSVSFCLSASDSIALEAMETAVRNIASTADFYHSADSASELEDAFSLISDEILYAASDAYFVDTMGANFDLLMKDHVYTDGNGQEQTITPVIQVGAYSLYTHQDAEDGLCTVAQVGTRKTDANGDPIYTLVEQITFNADGTQAYSNMVGSGTNILENGVICANTFWYNTTAATVTITLADGSTYPLPAETFYWKVGSISTREMVLSYSVYLTDALDENNDNVATAAGVYDTNSHAELFYTNYLGNSCSMTVASPKQPWNKATVGYGFYLVDKNGNPIVNQATGQAGSFQQSVKFGEVVYTDFEWGTTPQSLVASDLSKHLVSEGYELYDAQAKYEVSLDSNGTGYYTIYSNEKGAKTTYVTGISSTPVTGGTTAGQQTTTRDYATAGTVVWFAVRAVQDPLTVDKTVSKDGDDYTLTLEAFASGATTQISAVKPADIVLVLDQSASMYTPAGMAADRLLASEVRTAAIPASAKIENFDEEVANGNKTVLENAKHLGYYIAVHNKANYLYIVQYAKYDDGNDKTAGTADDKWGWFYVPVKDTTTPVKVDTANATPQTDTALANGGTYAQFSGSTMTAAILPDGDGGLVTYYQSQYGALYDSVNSFVKDLSQQAQANEVDHRLAIVGFSSPYYDAWNNYQGTGIYKDGQYYLYDTNYAYKSSDGTILDPDEGHEGSSFVEYPADASEYAYTGISADLYQNAFTDISTSAGLQSVQTSINALTTNYMQTCPGIGLRIARSIFRGEEIALNDPNASREERKTITAEQWIDAADADPEQVTSDRDQIVILFTDGVPTVSMYSSHEDAMTQKVEFNNEYWNGNAGMRDAINEANAAKQEGITIYTIGTAAASGSFTDERGIFLDLVSSNYLDSSSSYDVELHPDYNTIVQAHHLTITTGLQTDKSYALSATEDSGLHIAFGSIMNSITTPSVTLDGTDILRDVLSDYFDLIGTRPEVQVYTAAMNADGTFADPVLLRTAVVTYGKTDPNSDRLDIINVSGYDYSKEYILEDRSAETRKDAAGDLYYGSKLIVKVPVQVREGFWGGNDVPTNEKTTAIYDVNGAEEDVVIEFPIPTVNVPVQPSIFADDQVIYYSEDSIGITDVFDGTANRDLTDGITIAGKEIQVISDGKGGFVFQNADSGMEWADDYAYLTWTTGSDTVETPISNTKGDTYTFSIALKPRDTQASSVVGTAFPAAGNTASASGTVTVLVPVLTFRDSTILQGKETDKYYYDTTNYLGDEQIKWVDMSTYTGGAATDISDSVTIGSEPSLKLEYTPEGTGDDTFKVDTPVDVTVILSSEEINDVVWFQWQSCVSSLHDEDKITTHKGGTDQMEFWIHVSSIGDDDNGLVTDKKVTPVGDTNDQFLIELEAYATGQVEKITTVKPADIVLVLDHSASMRTPVGATEVLRRGTLYGEKGKTDKGQLTHAQLDTDLGQHMGYYVAQSSDPNSLAWFIMQYDANSSKWNLYSVPSTESIVNTSLEPGATGTEHTQKLTFSHDELPSQLVYYKSQYGMLYDSVLSFVQELHRSGVEHNVSIVGFAGHLTSGTRLYVGGDETAYKNYDSALYFPGDADSPPTSQTRREELYVKAMKNVADTTEYAELLTLIEAIDTNFSYTCPAAGIKLANEVLAANEVDAAERDRIVVLFTDGIPNVMIGEDKIDDSNTTTEIHNEILAQAYETKNTYDAKFYSISTSTTGDVASDRLFLNYSSSDYPNATSMTSTGTAIEGAPKYTMEVDSADELNDAFGSVTEQFTSTTVTLNNETLLVEILSDYFDLLNGGSKGDDDKYLDVRVYKVPFDGTGGWKTKEILTTAEIELGSTDTADRLDKVIVSGFDYSKEYISDTARQYTDANGNVIAEYFGSKLLVEVDIKTREGFWGGVNVPTNDAATGLYPDKDTDVPVEPFPVPEQTVVLDIVVEDTVVIDYGLSVDVDVIGNHPLLYGENTILGFVDQIPTKDLHSTLLENTATDSGSFGSIGLNYLADGTTPSGTIRYTLSKDKGMQMQTHETFYYVGSYVFNYEVDGVQVQETRYYYGKVTVIPATTMYFEEDFLTFDDAWTDVTGGSSAATQDQDRPGAALEDALGALDADNVYGKDSHYTDDLLYSNGTAKKTTVYDYTNTLTGASGTNKKTATATFRFTGTGFDVVSLTSNKTGVVLVNVFQLNDDGTRKDSYNSEEEFPDEEDTVVNPFANYIVDTYYGYTYTEEDGWVVTGGDEEKAIYQIPVIKVEDLPYDQYEVEVYVAYNQWFGHDQYTKDGVVEPKYDFYLDAIRIYDPANDGVGNETVKQAYKDDAEAWPSYNELRDLLLPTDILAEQEKLQAELDALQAELDALGTEPSEEQKQQIEALEQQIQEKKTELANALNEDFQGAIFIDGRTGVMQASDYASYGPNNELYLEVGQSVYFQIDTADTNIERVHLAMKSLNGTAYVQLSSNGTPLEPFTVASSTDLYYDITGLGEVTISNIGTGEGEVKTGGILSITNVKTTYKADPYGTGGSSLESGPFVSNGRGLQAALAVLNSQPVTDPELSLSYPSLSFEDEIFYNVYFTAGDISDVVEMGLMILPSYMADGTMDDAIGTVPGYVTNGSVYMAKSEGIAAAYMGDTMYFRVYAKLSDGSYVYSQAGGYNAKAYASTVLDGDYADEMKSLVVAMVNYGAEAQLFFGHNTDALVNAGLTDAQKALVSGYDESMVSAIVAAEESKLGSFLRDNANFKELYPSVSFDGAFSINYYCTPAIGVDDGITLYWWDAETYASIDEFTVENATGSMEMTVNEAGQYWGCVDGIAAKEMDDTYYVAGVFTSNGETVTTGIIAYSLGQYCESIAAKDGDDQQAFAQATAVYGYYAKQFFAAN